MDRWLRSSSHEKTGQLLLEQIVGSEIANKLLNFEFNDNENHDVHVVQEDDRMSQDMKVIFINREDKTDEIEMQVNRVIMKGNNEQIQIILSFRPSDSHMVVSVDSLLSDIMMKNMQDSILLLDKNGIISQTNEVTWKIFEYSKHEITGQYFTILFSDESKLICNNFISEVINKVQTQREK
eukprot:c1076_g1_i2.p1 GENE.c1076_g1_i2~~c1076_g1_i2.p1  ORF type:complete len:181 (+),score=57.85 c1076_g1_i2:167-709(+)